MRSTLKWVAASWGANLRSALEYRSSFVMQAVLMALNNLAFLCFWVVFFSRFRSVRGWELEDVALLFGISAAGYGTCVIALGGTFELARRIAAGDLDSWLARPRPVWLQGGLSSLQVAGFGDLASGVLLFVLAGHPTPQRAAAFVAMALASGTVLASFAILVGSLAFLGRMEDASLQLIHSLVSFGMYPPPLFSGGARLLLFAAIPAGLFSYVPAELVREWSWGKAGLLLLGITALVAVTTVAWRAGLARYESGNLAQAGE